MTAENEEVAETEAVRVSPFNMAAVIVLAPDKAAARASASVIAAVAVLAPLAETLMA
jgi:hypothetical protein